MTTVKVFAVIVSAGILLANGACTPEKEKTTAQFTLLEPEDTGVDFVNANAESDQQNILTYEYFYNGGGVALGDINNDGLVDIYFTSNQGANKLYLNKGDMKFEDITDRAGVGIPSGWKTGVSMADVNGDGYLDIYVCRSGDQHPLFRTNLLFINNKDLTFTDQAPARGLDDDSYSTQGMFHDFDHDGDLDVIMLNHSRLTLSNSYETNNRYGKKRVRYVGNQYYRNDGDHFIPLGDSVGIYGPASNYGLGIAAGDFNNDGWVDVYLTNDYTEKDKLLINDRGQRFIESSDSALTHMSEFSMGVDIADLNNDGWQDIVTLDMLPESNARQKEFYWPNRFDVYTSMVRNGLHHQFMRNMLQLNNGDGTFTEEGQLVGISNTDWSWSALIADFDNDGWQDLFVSNGFKRNFTSNDFLRYRADLSMKAQQGAVTKRLENILQEIPPTPAHNYFFRNSAGTRLEDVSESWDLGASTLTNGAAYGDLDNDGDLDLVLNNLNGPASIYRNNAEKSGNHFLTVTLRGEGGNTSGVGAQVTLYSEGRKMTRMQSPVRGFQSSVQPILFFGLGKATTIDSVRICWPSQKCEVIQVVPVDQQLIVEETNATERQRHAKAASSTFFAEVGRVPFKHTENDFVDFNTQNLLYRMYSTEGPAIAMADVNGDGVRDLYVGGALGQSGMMFLQNKSGSFTATLQKAITDDAASEDVDGLFFDMDGDGDQDLYVVSGGYELNDNDQRSQDRLYRNDGKGNFTAAKLPAMLSSGSCVRAADMDMDGDLDLFVGGRIVPGRYPETPTSYVLKNNGKGEFTIVTEQVAPALSTIGMVTDAQWADMNHDQLPDLVLVGEWMPVTIFINRGGKLEDSGSGFLPAHTEGWWSSLLVADINADGKPDIIAGNFGMNNQIRPTQSRPAMLYYADYDENGSVDPLLAYYIGDALYPAATRDELTERLPSMKKKFPEYGSYTKATISSILSADQLKRSEIRTANTFESVCFVSEGERLVMKPLPSRAQIAPIYALAATDVNHDGNVDLILGGNLRGVAPRFGMATGSYGTVLLGDGEGNFESSPESNLGIRGEIRKIIPDSGRFIIGLNNEQPRIFRLK